MMTDDDVRVGRQGEELAYQRTTEAGRPASETVLEAVAEVSGRSLVTTDADDPAETLAPLYRTVDPDALDALVDSTSSDGHPAIRIEFTYCGYRVTADDSGLVTVREL